MSSSVNDSYHGVCTHLHTTCLELQCVCVCIHVCVYVGENVHVVKKKKEKKERNGVSVSVYRLLTVKRQMTLRGGTASLPV